MHCLWSFLTKLRRRPKQTSKSFRVGESDCYVSNAQTHKSSRRADRHRAEFES